MEKALINFITLMVFPALLIAAAVTDIFTLKISNWISLILVVGFVTTATFTSMSGTAVLSHLAACGLILIIGFGLFSFNLIGGGDAKFLSAIALWFGLNGLIPLILITSLIGGVLCIILVFMRMHPLPKWASKQEWARRLHSKETGAPYGVAIAAAALVLYAETPLMA